MTWLPKIGEGPLWENRLNLEQERCQATWWTNILYVNNYVNTDQMVRFCTELFYIYGPILMLELLDILF